MENSKTKNLLENYAINQILFEILVKEIHGVYNKQLLQQTIS